MAHIGDSRAYLLRNGSLRPGDERPHLRAAPRRHRAALRRRRREPPQAQPHPARARRHRRERSRRHLRARDQARRPLDAVLRRPLRRREPRHDAHDAARGRGPWRLRRRPHRARARGGRARQRDVHHRRHRRHRRGPRRRGAVHRRPGRRRGRARPQPTLSRGGNACRAGRAALRPARRPTTRRISPRGSTLLGAVARAGCCRSSCCWRSLPRSGAPTRGRRRSTTSASTTASWRSTAASRDRSGPIDLSTLVEETDIPLDSLEPYARERIEATIRVGGVDDGPRGDRGPAGGRSSGNRRHRQIPARTRLRAVVARPRRRSSPSRRAASSTTTRTCSSISQMLWYTVVVVAVLLAIHLALRRWARDADPGHRAGGRGPHGRWPRDDSPHRLRMGGPRRAHPLWPDPVHVGAALGPASVHRDHRRASRLPRAAPLHLHRGRAWASSGCSCRSCPSSVARSTARASGSASSAARCSPASSPRSPSSSSSPATCRPIATPLRVAGPKILGIRFPRARDMGPLIVVWAAAHRRAGLRARPRHLAAALRHLRRHALRRHQAHQLGGARHGAVPRRRGVRRHRRSVTSGSRYVAWLHALDPDVYSSGQSQQLVRGLFGMASGGLFGTGLGQGRPDLVPYAYSDFIIASSARSWASRGSWRCSCST